LSEEREWSGPGVAVRMPSQTRDKANNFGTGRVDVYGAYTYGRHKGWW
jgi:hypothetical protein